MQSFSYEKNGRKYLMNKIYATRHLGKFQNVNVWEQQQIAM
jgi:hypothetical protein